MISAKIGWILESNCGLSQIYSGSGANYSCGSRCGIITMANQHIPCFAAIELADNLNSVQELRREILQVFALVIDLDYKERSGGK